MNYTQNSKIAQVTGRTLVIGVDIGSESNFARAFNWRGQELSRKVFRFSNSLEGFQNFLEYGVSEKLSAHRVCRADHCGL